MYFETFPEGAIQEFLQLQLDAILSSENAWAKHFNVIISQATRDHSNFDPVVIWRMYFKKFESELWAKGREVLGPEGISIFLNDLRHRLFSSHRRAGFVYFHQSVSPHIQIQSPNGDAPVVSLKSMCPRSQAAGFCSPAQGDLEFFEQLTNIPHFDPADRVYPYTSGQAADWKDCMEKQS